jgi:hypothetical protein
MENLKIGSNWKFECRSKDGKLKWEDEIHNVVTDEGFTKLLDVMFHGGTQITTWYILLYETNTTPTTSTTYATPIFTETSSYDEANRVEYNEAAATGNAITNSANKARFTFNASKTIYGGALVGGGVAPSTKGNIAGGGTMFCAALLDAAKVVTDDDYLDITITISKT